MADEAACGRVVDKQVAWVRVVWVVRPPRERLGEDQGAATIWGRLWRVAAFDGRVFGLAILQVRSIAVGCRLQLFSTVVRRASWHVRLAIVSTLGLVCHPQQREKLDSVAACV